MRSNKSFIQYEETCFVQIMKLSVDHTKYLVYVADCIQILLSFKSLASKYFSSLTLQFPCLPILFQVIADIFMTDVRHHTLLRIEL